MSHDPLSLPPDLPVPEDDGAADHLVGMAMPDAALTATDGSAVSLARVRGRVVVYAYPRTGRPGEPELVEDWDLIPGARGCTPEACAFRDHHAELADLDASVYGLSTQSPDYQREAVERLHLPFAILSDQHLTLARELDLPTFEAAGHILLRRLTMLVRGGVVEHVWYPVFPPDEHAEQVADWLRKNPA